MKLLDLFCGAGGAAMGYHRAGFEVTGVDINPQPRFPFTFIQADALEYLAAHGKEYDVIHASPPCQIHSTMTKGIHQDKLNDHINLIPNIRRLLKQIGRPYIIENVMGAKDEMVNPLMLCGTMFNLRARNGAQLWRHRLFESCPAVWFPPATCKHEKAPTIGVYGGGQHPLKKHRKRKNHVIGVYGSTGGQSNRDNKSFYGIKDRKIAMGIDWMSGKELNQAIPPAYTHWLGLQIKRQLAHDNTRQRKHYSPGSQPG